MDICLQQDNGNRTQNDPFDLSDGRLSPVESVVECDAARAQQDRDTTSTGSAVIRPGDIVLGRSASVAAYPGNLYFWALIVSHRREYLRNSNNDNNNNTDDGDRRRKRRAIVRHILRCIQRRIDAGAQCVRRMSRSGRQQVVALGLVTRRQARDCWSDCSDDVILIMEIKRALRTFCTLSSIAVYAAEDCMFRLLNFSFLCAS
jgi:hypothetical protein